MHLYPQTEKMGLYAQNHKRKNPHSRSSGKREKTVGIFICRIHENDRNSCVTHRFGDAIFKILISSRKLWIIIEFLFMMEFYEIYGEIKRAKPSQH